MLDPVEYTQKFSGFLDLCREAKVKGVKQVIIANPIALGDNFDEIVESLNRLADADLTLVICDRFEPKG